MRSGCHWLRAIAAVVTASVAMGGDIPHQEHKNPCPPDPDDLHISDPVFMGTKRFTYDHVDLSLTVVGGALEFGRTYRSYAKALPVQFTMPPSPMGRNWRHGFESYLAPSFPGASDYRGYRVYMVTGEGRAEEFRFFAWTDDSMRTCPPSVRLYLAAPGGEDVLEVVLVPVDCLCTNPEQGIVQVQPGDWIHPPNGIDSLEGATLPPLVAGSCSTISVPHSMRMIHADGGETTYGLFPSMVSGTFWRPTSTLRASGAIQFYEYDEHQRLASVSLGGGGFTFQYQATEPAALARLASVTDSAGRVVAFDYCGVNDSVGKPGDLKTASIGGFTGDVPRVWSYAYRTDEEPPEPAGSEPLQALLTRITDPRGNVMVENHYGVHDQVVHQKRYGESYFYTLTPPSEGVYRTVSVNRSGQAREFLFQEREWPDGPLMLSMREYFGVVPLELRTVQAFNAVGWFAGDVLVAGDRSTGNPAGYSETLYTFTNEMDPDDLGVDENGQVRSIVYPDGSSEERQYNFDSNLTPPTAMSNNAVLLRLWLGQLREVRRTGVSVNGQPPVTTVESFTYNPLMPAGAPGCGCTGFRPTTYTDAEQRTTTFEYHGFGPPVRTTYPASSGEPVAAQSELLGGAIRPYARLWPQGGNGRRRDEFVYGDVANPYTGGVQPSAGPTLVRVGVVNGAAALERGYEYNHLGDVVRSIDGFGKDTVFTYNGFREVVRVDSRPGPGGARITTWLRRDQAGRVLREDQENRGPDGVLSSVNPLFTTMREFDAAGRLTRVAVEAVDADVPSEVGTIGAIPNPERFAITEYRYNAEDMLTEVRGPEVTSGLQPNAVVSMVYDTFNRLYRVQRGAAPGALVTQFDYDGAGNLTAMIEGAAGTAPTPRITTFVNDGLGNVVATVLPNGTRVDRLYDRVGNLLRSSVTGAVSSGAGPPVVLAQSEFEYDARDRLTSEGRRWFDSSIGETPSVTTPWVRTAYAYHADSTLFTVTPPNGQFAVFHYDAALRPWKRTDPFGNTVEFAYDDNGNIRQVVTREVNGLDPSASAVRTTRTEYVHDALDRAQQIKRFTGSSSFAASSLLHDSRGNVVESWDPRSKRTRYTYDALGRPLETRRLMDDQTEIVTGSAWDIASRLIAQTDHAGNTTRYAYDDFGRLAIVRLADGTLQQVGEGAVWPDGAGVPSTWGTPGFDTLGNALVASVGRPGGRIRVTGAYDVMGAPVSRAIEYLDGPGHAASEHFQYDGLGRLLRAWSRDDTLGAHSTAARRYDSLSRLVAESTDFEPLAYPGFNPSVPATVGYTYTPGGEVSHVAYPSGRVVRWERDALDRVARIADVLPAPLPERMLAQFTYSGPGRLVRQQNGNGTETRWSYNGLLGPNGESLLPDDPDAPPLGDLGFGRVTRVRHSAAATAQTPAPLPFDAWTLTWDAANNKTARQQVGFLGDAVNPAFAGADGVYGYDAIDRLVTSQVVVAGEQGAKDARWRDLESYTLDGVHNRVSVSGGSAPGAYSLGASGSGPRRLNQYSASPLNQYLYDQRGNLRAESAHCRGDIAPVQANGDIGDHRVDTGDMARLIGQFGQPVTPGAGGNAECDINGDGLISTADLQALLGNFGAGCDWTEYRYDWADRLVEVKASSWANGQSAATPARVEVHRYQYDALGRRIARTLWAAGSMGVGVPSSPLCTRFIHGGVGDAGDARVGWQVLEERDAGPNGGRVLATFVASGRYVDETVCFRRDLAGSGLLGAAGSSPTPPVEPGCGPGASGVAADEREYWLHADDLFNTTSVTDSSGAVVERYEYHDYGFPLILDAAGEPSGVNALGLYASKVGNARLFTGREWDGEAKVYHYRTRAYHPGLGRFMSVDRIGVWGDGSQLGNGFAGMAGNPLRWVDPWGLEAVSQPQVIVKNPGSPAESVKVVVHHYQQQSGLGLVFADTGIQYTGTSDLGEFQVTDPVEMDRLLVTLDRIGWLDTAANEVAQAMVDEYGPLAVMVPVTVKPAGQLHHAISKRVWDVLENMPQLRKYLKLRDNRLVTRAIDALAHRGYQRWHRDYDAEVAEWLLNNADATLEEFLKYLHKLYQRSDLKARFPCGLPKLHAPSLPKLPSR
ncbi:MAG: hypothetical protein J0L61_04925 [Planctomycetes bacterium]|nr:hypothetical protein [Planctomycetota bacterium]